MNKNSQEAFNVQLERQEFLHLLKYGRGEEARAIIEQQKRQNYSNEFVPFMDQMIQEHKISRKNVAVKSGLSQDYVYKLLRGDKHTDERDYILAMCFAIGMNLSQVQHALASYGMPILSEGDVRSHVIIWAIQNGDDIDDLNEMLEEAGFPLLKTSPDMPSATIADIGEVKVASEKREFSEIDSFTEGHHNGGLAPFDYDYQGWIKIEDEEGNIYQVEAIFKSDYSSFLVFTEEQRKEAERLMLLEQQRQIDFFENHKEELAATNGAVDPYVQPELYNEYLALSDDIPVAEMLECYDCLEDAAGSEFFPFFLEIDKRTDKEVLKVMNKLDDTREYGMRVGSSWVDEKSANYIEWFNDEQPELREYLQVIEYSDGTCRYTASHDSCFMQLQLGQQMYEAYFGYKREPEFYINTEKNEFSGAQLRYQFIFSNLARVLHDYYPKTNGDHTYNPENTACGNSVVALMAEFRKAIGEGNYDEAKNYAEEAVDLIENHNASSDDWAVQFDTYGSYASVLEDEKLEESLVYYKKALTVARNHHLDQDWRCAHAVAIQYNNYAWMLWNKCGSEEAVLHYGRAIDLLESYLFSGIVDRDTVINDLEHVGKTLNQIYIDTSRPREAEQLKERLAENGIILNK